MTLDGIEWRHRYRMSLESIHDIELQVGRASLILYVCGSFADIYVVLTLIPEVRLKNQGSGIFVLLNERWNDLARRFSYPYLRYHAISDQQEAHLRAALHSMPRPYILKPGRFFPTLPTLHPYLGELALTKRLSDVEVYRLMLDLPEKVPLLRPPLSEERLREVEAIFNREGLRQGKTFVVAFSGQTNKLPSSTFQTNVIRAIQKAGYDVLINSAQTFPSWKGASAAVVDNVPVLSFPPDICVELADYAGGYIGGPNGLTVLVSLFSKLKGIMQTADFSNFVADKTAFGENKVNYLVSNVLKGEAHIPVSVLFSDDGSDLSFSEQSLLHFLSTLALPQ